MAQPGEYPRLHVQNEKNVAPNAGSGAMKTAYKAEMLGSVVFIDPCNPNGDGQGTGCLVLFRFQPMLLTCHHVIPSADVARQCTVHFDREDTTNPGTSLCGKDLLDLSTFTTRDKAVNDLDFTIIGLKRDVVPGIEARRMFPLNECLTLKEEARVSKMDNVFLLHYPLMENAFVRRESAYVVEFVTGFLFGHKAETHGGSSGCPVLKEVGGRWVLVGLHRANIDVELNGSFRVFNIATLAEVIFRTLEESGYTAPQPDFSTVQHESAYSRAPVPDRRTPEAVKFMDCSPSDIGLQRVVGAVPDAWQKLAVNLGVPLPQVRAYGNDRSGLGEVDALRYWRDGRSGSEHPSTWAYLLKMVEETVGSAVSSDLRLKVEKETKLSKLQ